MEWKDIRRCYINWDVPLEYQAKLFSLKYTVDDGIATGLFYIGVTGGGAGFVFAF